MNIPHLIDVIRTLRGNVEMTHRVLQEHLEDISAVARSGEEGRRALHELIYHSEKVVLALKTALAAPAL